LVSGVDIQKVEILPTTDFQGNKEFHSFLKISAGIVWLQEILCMSEVFELN
jgi:hypothetical protein